MSDPETTARLAAVEGLLRQVLDELRSRKRLGRKRSRSTSQRAYVAALAETKYKPTELQIAAAKRALRKRS